MLEGLFKGIQGIGSSSVRNVASARASPFALSTGYVGAEQAKRLSAVYGCVEIISNSMGKLPMYVVNRRSWETQHDHPLEQMLTVRANEAMAPSVAKHMLASNCLCTGNGVAWIVRDKAMRPVEYLPIPGEMVSIFRDVRGRVRYHITLPLTGEPIILDRTDVIHIMGPTNNGYTGRSVLSYASEVVASALAAQSYNKNYYLNGGQPSGVLQTDADLTKSIQRPDGSTVAIKDAIRESWETVHSGPTNAQRIAILDHGLKYTPISVSNRDAQFVESYGLSVEDIARFFTMPLYKLGAGKQSYNSNEQNAIEYVTGCLHPKVAQWEEELTYKLLTDDAIGKGLAIEMDLTEELRGDAAARASYYTNMRNTGAFSVNDIRARERLPAVPGGDERLASLNYAPLELWRELSIRRNGGKEKA